MALLSDGQINVLRKVVKDPAFRQAFTADPQKAIASAGIQLSPSEVQQLSKVTPQAINQVKAGIASANDDDDGTHTLLYAVAVAALIA
jgi:hypothetical protein